MSIEQPVHLADFDYRDPEQVKKYALAMKQMTEMDAAWSAIETKALALAEMKDAAQITAAITELERLRNAADTKTTKSDTAIASLLPDVVPPIPEPEGQ